MAVYLATELKHNPLEADDDEFLEVEKISIENAFEMAEKGEIPDAKSLAALLLVKPYLK
jgi:ADP-ribose pyrophosphatase